jgi:hypothetical protein
MSWSSISLTCLSDADPRRADDHLRYKEPPRPQLWHPGRVDGGWPDRDVGLYRFNAATEPEETTACSAIVTGWMHAYRAWMGRNFDLHKIAS